MRGRTLGLTIASWLTVTGGLVGAQPNEPPSVVASPASVDEPAAGEEQNKTATGATQPSPSAATDAAAATATPEVSGSAGASASSAAAAGTPKPEDGICNPATDTCLVAETQGRENGHIWARGFADLRMGEMRVQADRLDIYDVEHDGVTTQRLTAEGNVVLLHRQDRLAGTKLSMDLDSGRGTMLDVVGYTDPGVYFTAEKVERIDPTTYRITHGRFTSCCQPEPRWSFSTPRATLKVEDHITAVAAHFNLGAPLTGQQFPLLFLPYFYYPVKPDGRATGFLLPSFNIDFKRGVDVRMGFFLTMGRSADQTFGFERRASPTSDPLPPKYSHELRWASDGRSYGDLRTALFPAAKTAPVPGITPNNSWDWSLNWNAQQTLPGRVQARVFANVTSPQDYLSPVSQYYNTNSHMALTLQRSIGWQIAQIQFDNNNSESSSVTVANGTQTIRRRLLPRFTLSQMSRGIGKTGIRWTYSASVDHLDVLRHLDVVTQNPDGTQTTTTTDRIQDNWWRFDIAPSISRPFATSFLSVTPTLTTRYTRYSKSCPPDRPECGKNLVDAPITRRYVEGSVEILGPQFARVFSGPARYSDLIKHVIGPEVVWLYREATDNFAAIPRFGDSVDRTARASELRYGISQQLWGRRKLSNGGTRPFRFLSWTVYRKRYFLSPLVAQDRDFRAYLWDGARPAQPVRLSPIHSKLEFSPLSGLSFTWLQEYDPSRKKSESNAENEDDESAKKTRRLDLGIRISGPSGRLQVDWSRSPSIFDEDLQRVTYSAQNSLRFNSELALSKLLRISGAADYSLIDQKYGDAISSPKGFVSRSASMKFDFQCLGITLIYTQRVLGLTPEGKRNYNGSFQFAIELANIGTFGLGPGGAALGGAGLGGRR